MSYKIKRVDYFYITVKDKPGEAYQLLNQLAEQGINMLAFSAMPMGPSSTQMTIFPEDKNNLESLAKKIGMDLIGPFPAFIVNGSDELGALAYIHRMLYQGNINVVASNGLGDGHESYNYIIYVRPEDYERAAKVLEI